MIPLHLSLSGFLSYRDPVELDFCSFELACIAGANGAGKSSLLDAITWALFGVARRRDDALINAQSAAAEICLIFGYETNIYRIQRSKPRDKTMLLEFHILQDRSVWDGEHGVDLSSLGPWKALTERTLRDTEMRIQETLRMDYETFVNASFFLQGKADLFTQQRPGDRKRILGSILGLEIWETYRQRAVERRKAAETEISGLEGRLHEIDAELDEENERKTRLEQLEAELKRMARQRQTQETALDAIRKVAATLAEQRRLVEALARQALASSQRQSELDNRLAARCRERDSFAGLLQRASEIEAAYANWQKLRKDLECWEGVAVRFREQEKRRQGPLDEINAARARLQHECDDLNNRRTQALVAQAEIHQLHTQIQAAQAELALSEAQLARREQLHIDLLEAGQHQADSRAENNRLRGEMDELKERIRQLEEVEGAACPLCGQELSPGDRQRLIDSLNLQGREMGDRFRANKSYLDQAESLVRSLKTEFDGLTRIETAERQQRQSLDRQTNRLEQLEKQWQEWENQQSPRLDEICALVDSETFAPQARLRLAEVDAELKAIGYDAAAHDTTRRAEVLARGSEAGLRDLEKARAALEPLEREIADLAGQAKILHEEVARQIEEHRQAAASLEQAEAQAPDLEAAERELLILQEQENRLRGEVGAARQKVLVLDDLKARRKRLEIQRETHARQVSQFRQLERAFGKDGVPALLIEQSLPQIESRANEILDRLSGGSMSVRFITQSAYKDKRREDLRETLDIQISDGSGTRDYEMYSGGEAFRVNFAVRLALSEVLAQRAGARLQTLVVDEGFGSQDTQGRQRLIEAINLVRHDFAKVLVITHIDELKEAFPTRIEVEKTERGSVVKVV